MWFKGGTVMYCHNSVMKVKERAKLSDYIQEKNGCLKCGNDLILDEKTRFFHCKGCGKRGLVFTYLMEKENKDFNKVIEELAEKENVVLQECIYKDSKYDLDKCKKCKLFMN